MPQLTLLISPPVLHTEPNDECPFCPPPESKTYKTYPGKANNSKKLAEIMEKPSELTSKQSNARPQTGKSDQDGYTQEQQPLDPRLKDDSVSYTFQAHHLISGNQALKGSPMEDWILASSVNEKDTGYSVNSTGNGYWAPSVPKQFVGKWGPSKKILTDAERQTHAEGVMQAANAQVHIGPHNISDPDDPDGDIHPSYDKYIIKYLEDISNRIHAWANACFLCDPKNKKSQANYHVHDVLDRLSTHLQTEITGSRESWRIFLSKYARDYHKPVCTHTGDEDF